MSESGFSDDQLRQAFSRLSETAIPRGDCPAPEQIWYAKRGELGAEERQHLIDHVSGCPVCAEAWRIAHELQESARSGKSGQRNYRRHLRWAAAILICVGLVLVLGRLSDVGQEHALRNAPESEIQSLIPAGTSLQRAHFLLRWTPGLEGSRYDLTVTTRTT